MAELVFREKPDGVIHLGDSSRDAETLLEEFPGLRLWTVRGNCDLHASAPERQTPQIGGLRFFLTHGHTYHVKYGTAALFNAASCAGTDVLLYGHTHRQEGRSFCGMTVINPGSIGYGCAYAVLELENGTCRYALRTL